MSMLSIEKRPVNPRAIYWACMVGLSIAIPALIIAPKVIEARDGTIIQSGDRVIHDGVLHSIREIEDDRLLICHVPTLQEKWVKRSEIKQHPMDVPPQYHWWLALTQ